MSKNLNMHEKGVGRSTKLQLSHRINNTKSIFQPLKFAVCLCCGVRCGRYRVACACADLSTPTTRA